MDFTKFIKMLNENKKNYAHTWFELVENSEYMETYKKLDKDIVLERGEAVMTHLANWLETGASNDVAEKYFEEVGRERFREGFPLTEVIYALHLVKKVFWCCVAWAKEEAQERPHDNCEYCIEFLTILGNYFDLGNFYLTRGYFQSVFKELDKTSFAGKDELKNFLKKGIINLEDLDKEEFIWRHV